MVSCDDRLVGFLCTPRDEPLAGMVKLMLDLTF
jgi:hypothetical protein